MNVGSQNTCQGRNKPILDVRFEGSVLRFLFYTKERISRERDDIKASSRVWRLWSSEIPRKLYCARMWTARTKREHECASILEERSRQRLHRALTKRVARQLLKRNTCAEKGNVKYSRHAYVTTKTRSPDHFFLPRNFLNCVHFERDVSQILGIS